MVLSLFDKQFMINNNPYNVPERPIKQQRKVVVETSPLYPHQANRIQEELELKNRNFLQKRATLPQFLQSSVTEVSRGPLQHQNSMHVNSLQMSQMSNVSHWNPQPSGFQLPSIEELNDKLLAVNARLDRQEHKLHSFMSASKAQTTQTNLPTHLTDSTALSQELSSLSSRQMQRYHSSEQPWDKLREEFSSYRSQSEQLGQSLRAELQEQRASIAQQLIENFKESLSQKFSDQELKIAEYLSDFQQQEAERFEEQAKEMAERVKRELQTVVGQFTEAREQGEAKASVDREQNQLRQGLTRLTVAFEQLQSNYKNFKEEVFDNVLATQDHKRWLYELDQHIVSLKSTPHHQSNCRGTISVSSEYCPKEVLHLRYQQYLSIAQKPSSLPIQSTHRTYLIDIEGFLLDSNHFYLIDSKGRRIQLQQAETNKLKEAGLLQ